MKREHCRNPIRAVSLKPQTESPKGFLDGFYASINELAAGTPTVRVHRVRHTLKISAGPGSIVPRSPQGEVP
jgi:hypothetical protein